MGEREFRVKPNLDKKPQGEKDLRINHRLAMIPDASEEAWFKAALTVCDPARGLSKEDAKTVLTALGVLDDPEHVVKNWMGRKVEADGRTHSTRP
jgi:hypothetical protein